MITTIVDVIIGSCVFVSVCLTFMSIYYLEKVVPKEDREYMDPLPPVLEFIWPLVRIVAYYICAKFPFPYLTAVENRLKKSGVSYMMIAEEYIALRIISSLSFLFVWFFALELVDKWNDLFFIIIPAIGYFYPDIWMRDIRKKQVDKVLRTLPAYLDFITMAVEAGLNFTGALEQARKKGPASPLSIEFKFVLRDLRAGIKRDKSLQRMAQRLDIHEVTSFVNAIVQAEKMGSSMANVLRIQAEQRRNERFQRAEKKAMEAPVKLIGPLVIFIFPTTFMVLAFPIAMKFMQQGMF